MKNLNFKLYRFVADAFILTTNAASRLIAFLYFVLIIAFSTVVDLLIEDTPVWQDYDRFRFSYLLLIIFVFSWIGWVVYMYGFGGAKKLEEKYLESIRSKNNYPENLY